jgi:hypothetical protein
MIPEVTLSAGEHLVTFGPGTALLGFTLLVMWNLLALYFVIKFWAWLFRTVYNWFQS